MILIFFDPQYGLTLSNAEIINNFIDIFSIPAFKRRYDAPHHTVSPSCRVALLYDPWRSDIAVIKRIEYIEQLG